MQDAEVERQVKKKRFLIDAFLCTSSIKASDGPDKVLKHAVTSHFLQAVILELIIKLLYELNQKDTAPFTHNILRVFNELNQDTKDHLVSKFDKARARQQEQFGGIDDVQFYPLEDVLANNKKLQIRCYGCT